MKENPEKPSILKGDRSQPSPLKMDLKYWRIIKWGFTGPIMIHGEVPVRFFLWKIKAGTGSLPSQI